MEESSCLEIKNYELSFENGKERKSALKGINLTIKQGSTLGLVGESGSGKSLTSLSVMGLLPNLKNKNQIGTILFKTRSGATLNLLALSNKEWNKIRGKHISMIFQEPMTALNPVIRCGIQVEENLNKSISLSKKQKKQKVLEQFELVGLQNPERIYSAWPHELSGGQRQRVMIAMAIISGPELLIADEPTTALDVTVQKSILDLLRKLQKDLNLAMLFISHDLGVIGEISDYTAVLYNGQIVEQGLTKTVLQIPSHPYTKGLIACRPPKTGRPDKLLTVSDFMIGEEEKNSLTQSDYNTSFTEEKKQGQKEDLLEIENLEVVFGNKKNIFKAVKKVSLKIKKGESIGLVGESGCGKSTIGRSITGLNQPAQGKIKFLNQEVTPQKRNCKIQLIFQDPYSALNPTLTAGECIEEVLMVHSPKLNKKERTEKVLDLFEKTGLEANHYNRYPHEFSGGQRQRIVIARAIAADPELLICDESVAALDVSVQAQILNLLNELKKTHGFSYLFISHDLAVVRYFCDRIFVMENGRFVEEGESDEVFSNPQNAYTKKLIDSIPGKTLSL